MMMKMTMDWIDGEEDGSGDSQQVMDQSQTISLSMYTTTRQQRLKTTVCACVRGLCQAPPLSLSQRVGIGELETESTRMAHTHTYFHC